MQFPVRTKLEAQLPATKCTPDMQDRVKNIADEHNVSIGEVIRSALSIFLDQIATNSVTNDTKSKSD